MSIPDKNENNTFTAVEIDKLELKNLEQEYSQPLLKWAKVHGRHDLPWQKNATPYRVWVSEIMLQQTQVATVIDYYLKFLSCFPTIDELAKATQDEVLSLWSGLGYYARARNLHKTAILIINDYSGHFPQTIDELETLPGIGRSTAGAILSLSMGLFAPILDGNCKRVYSRYSKVKGHYSTAATMKKLWVIAGAATPKNASAAFNQAMMDLGSSVCTRTKPKCLLDKLNCPLSDTCEAFRDNEIALYPEKKKKKISPVKNAIFIILKDTNDQLLLEKRPGVGIWGGLWCFPQFDTIEQVKSWIDNEASDYKLIHESKPKQHVFSHYKLNYFTQEYSLSHKQKDKIINLREGENEAWYSLSKALQLGLPTPIKKILMARK